MIRALPSRQLPRGARSVALASFGLDSLIEIGASVVVVWELTGTNRGCQRRAPRLIGAAFALLALYLVVQGARGAGHWSPRRPQREGRLVILRNLLAVHLDVGRGADLFLGHDDPKVIGADMGAGQRHHDDNDHAHHHDRGAWV